MDIAAPQPAELNPPLHANAPLTTADKVVLTAVAIGCYVVWYYIYKTCGLPNIPQISSLLLHQGFVGVVVTAILMPVLAVTCTAGLGRIRPEAGVFCATLGLLALPTHGGDIRNALLDAGSYNVFLTMAIEQILLWIIVGGSLLAAESLGHRLHAKFTETEEGETTSDRLTVIGSQAAAVLILMAFVGQSPVKGQAMVGLGVAAMGSAILIHQSYKLAGAFWYVTGTMLAGLVAYLWGRFIQSGADIGDVSGWLAGPARSLPLHYASIGVAGTIYGYWISMTWEETKQLPSEVAVVAHAALSR